MRKSIEIFIIFMLFFITLNVFAGEVDIAADSLEYVENRGRINAKGNVVLNWEDKKVYADYVEFVTDKKIMNAYGDVKVEENGSTTRADSVSYNYDDETGDIKETFTYSSTVFMRAKSMERQGNDTFTIKNIKLSACDCDEPHTYFKSKRGKLVLNKRVTIYNAVLYAGKIPIFYLPVVTKSLDGKGGINLKLKVEPGYNKAGGPFLKNAVLFSFFGEIINGKIKYDYLCKRGHGYGLEASLSTNKLKVDFHGYKINDLIDKKDKWEAKPSCFWRANNLWTIRGGLELQDGEGLHDYDLAGCGNMVANTRRGRMRSHASATRQGRRACLATYFEHNEEWDKEIEKYEVTSKKIPGIELSFWPRKTFMNIYHYPHFKYEHHYAEHDPKTKNAEHASKTKNHFFRNTILLEHTLVKNYRLCKNLTLKPTFRVTENFYDIDKKGNRKNDFADLFTQYHGRLDLRFRAASWMDWNAGYVCRIRTEPNHLLDIDKHAEDYGVEYNGVPLGNTMYLGEKITVENQIAYNMLRNRQPSKQYPQWLPLITELTWTPKHFVTVIARETQLIKPCKFGSFLLDLTVGEPKKAYVNFTSIYQNYGDNVIKNVFGFGVWLTPKWRLDYNIRTTLPVNFSDMRMNDQEIRLYRDGHCWHLGIGWKIIKSAKPDSNIFFKFELKTNMPFSGKAQDNFGYDDPDAIFYPWEDKDPVGTL
ncbi:MAG: hypothetical protein LE168_04300 [Endomicrobium sp.]|nr:hypothetical protein [Endomicrobium sp.]